MLSTRDQIIKYLANHTEVKIKDISAALNLTSADIRYHISSLLMEKILIQTQAAVAGRGRPARRYSLAPNARQNNYTHLASSLLTCLVPPGDYTKLEVLASIMLGEIQTHPGTGGFIAGIEWLNEHSYNARWEAHHRNPRIIFHHCPYLTLVERFPELCIIDRIILEKITAQPVDQISRLEKSGFSGLRCVFLVSGKQTTDA